jgi:uncharacterized repeat protein (TIGR02543 family)
MVNKHRVPVIITLAVIVSCALMAAACLLGDDIETLRAKGALDAPVPPKAVTYTVTFNANGGSGTTPTAQTVTAGASIILPGGSYQPLSRSGYTFGGWNTNTSGTGYNYNAGSPYTPTGSITLYARWDYIVTFNINGGTGTTPAAQTVQVIGSSIILPDGSGFSRSGYTFGGWNTNAAGTGTSYAAGSSCTPASSITLYARWIQIIPEMVYVPSGSFQMGNPDSSVGISNERPVHTVTLSGFYIGKYEVTQALYQSVTGNNPSYFSGSNLPVENVSWYDAVEFCNKLSEREGRQAVYTITDRIPAMGYPIASATVTVNWSRNGYRLPTEAQWEYAAKGGNGSPGNYTYAGSNTVGNVAWYSGNNGSSGTSTYGTKAVGTKSPNGLGLYDMSGNVAEWCWDWHGDYPSGAQTDPAGASSGSVRVDRGGCWSYPADMARSARRYGGNPADRSIAVGFRVARPAQ